MNKYFAAGNRTTNHKSYFGFCSYSISFKHISLSQPIKFPGILKQRPKQIKLKSTNNASLNAQFFQRTKKIIDSQLDFSFLKR